MPVVAVSIDRSATDAFDRKRYRYWFFVDVRPMKVLDSWPGAGIMHARQYLYVGLCIVAILSCGACLPCE